MTWKEQPKAWGWFHILGIGLAIVFILAGLSLGRKHPISKDRRKSEMILWICCAFFISIEILKEIMLVIRNGFVLGELPFQICSLIIFALPIMLLVKKESAKEALISFLSSFCMTGAFFYFVKPSTALNSTSILISIRSYLWHWMILFTCSFIIESYEIFRKKKTAFFLKGYGIWLCCLVIAVGIDTLAYFLLPDQNIDFFYIGYGNKPFYPILNLIFTTQICMEYYPLYLIAFALYYGLGSLLMYFLFKGIHSLEEILVSHTKQKCIPSE